jgi:1,5-anhydro-D-fructose reductase (1,5-anhydro-D-mannitol-forming)
MNWLVIGIGDITIKRVIPAILEEPRSCLYGIVTRDPAKARPYAAKVWTDLTAALQDAEIEAVYVGTPVSLHAPQTIASVCAGKHVLCEKPVALDYAEARTMVQAAEEAGRTLGIAYYRRMYPKLQRAKALIGEGAIGQPVMAELSNHYWYDETGHGPWRLDPKMAGGGPLYDIASHRIDVLNFLFGRPVRATGLIANAVHQYGVEDCATVLVEYENRARGIVDVRWHSRVVRDECRIVGTDGALDLTPLNGPELKYPGGEESLPVHKNLHYPCVENFVSAVMDGAHLHASGASSIWTDWVTAEVLLPGLLDPVR